jgi:hypothetical protein
LDVHFKPCQPSEVLWITQVPPVDFARSAEQGSRYLLPEIARRKIPATNEYGELVNATSFDDTMNKKAGFVDSRKFTDPLQSGDQVIRMSSIIAVNALNTL